MAHVKVTYVGGGAGIIEAGEAFYPKFTLRPPSTAIICPVIYGASLIRKATVLAMSSGSPVRFSSVRLMMCWREASFIHSPASGQRIGPGEIPFTRTSGASSSAKDRVSEARPPLAALYTT